MICSHHLHMNQSRVTQSQFHLLVRVFLCLVLDSLLIWFKYSFTVYISGLSTIFEGTDSCSPWSICLNSLLVIRDNWLKLPLLVFSFSSITLVDLASIFIAFNFVLLLVVMLCWVSISCVIMLNALWSVCRVDSRPN